jgi:hypothetical protein
VPWLVFPASIERAPVLIRWISPFRTNPEAELRSWRERLLE